MNQVKHKILVAPLDWGLGHATRSIRVIKELQAKHCEVFIASSGAALVLLKEEFPQHFFFELPSYRAAYSKYFPLILKVIFQLPKFLAVIWMEHRKTEKIVTEHQIDFVISDSRFGCWTKLVPTVFITHQVNIQMPFFLKWLQPTVNYFNHRQIRKFNYCWIPDHPTVRLTGKLSATDNFKLVFIGMLSRFNKVEPQPKRYDVLALISGPEPQRSMFESLIRKQLTSMHGRKLMVKGLPGFGSEIKKIDDLQEVNHVATDTLQLIIASSDLVVCRSGYSTVMDLALLNKKAVFVPTPGQTEQEILADELEKRGIAYYQKQKDFDIAVAMEKSKAYSGFVGWNSDSNLLANAIDDLLVQKNKSTPLQQS